MSINPLVHDRGVPLPPQGVPEAHEIIGVIEIHPVESGEVSTVHIGLEEADGATRRDKPSNLGIRKILADDIQENDGAQTMAEKNQWQAAPKGIERLANLGPDARPVGG